MVEVEEVIRIERRRDLAGEVYLREAYSSEEEEKEEEEKEDI